MSKIGEKESVLEHVQKHIDTAEHRSNRAKQWLAEYIDGKIENPELLEIVEIACESVEAHMNAAAKHLHQYRP
jgi:hypothetical protein